jgi:hypothetical protein
MRLQLTNEEYAEQDSVNEAAAGMPQPFCFHARYLLEQIPFTRAGILKFDLI